MGDYKPGVVHLDQVPSLTCSGRPRVGPWGTPPPLPEPESLICCLLKRS